MHSNDFLLEEIRDQLGFESFEEMFENAVLDSVVPNICRKCLYITDLEPDQDEGWCPECDETSMVSVLVLAGLI